VVLHRFEVRQTLPITRREAWAFFSDPRNLGRITPPSLGFEITSPLPERAYAGMIVAYRVRPLFGIRVTWVTEITHVIEESRFVDEQRMGPYRFWHHQHDFSDVPGGVELRDVVHYVPPFGPLGRVINRAIVAPRLRTIFAYRYQALAARFGVLEGGECALGAPERAPRARVARVVLRIAGALTGAATPSGRL
jgi:ligand-binding SRPBCC domain-containing protein